MWRTLKIEGKSVTSVLNSQFSNLDEKYFNIFPNLRKEKTLLAVSDYSGETSDSKFEVFSFMLISVSSWKAWDKKRLIIRQTHLSDSRRMSFKRLNDNQRKAALFPLLSVASDLEGLSFTVARHKRCVRMFHDPPLDLAQEGFEQYEKWKPKILEKAFFISHILSLMIGGLAAPMQNVLWFTDEDAIAANDQRLGELTNLFSKISGTYLPFNLGHMRCGTSKSDDGTLQLEDIIAIPDLIAGSLYEQMKLTRFGNNPLGDVFWAYSPDMSDKTKMITEWYTNVSCPLKKMVAIIEPDIQKNNNIISLHHFYNQID